MMFTSQNGRYQTRDAPTDRSSQRRRAVMASVSVVLLAALGAAVYFSCLGAALVRWIRPVWAPVAGIGPMLGWAVFSALAFPLQSLFGFGLASTVVLAGLALGASVATLVLTQRRSAAAVAARLPRWTHLLAGLIALVPLAAVLPKHTAEGVILATPMFDHSKAAIVDEIRRLGLPAGNAFFGAGGARGSLSYYFLWHFGAAQLSVLSGASGWEADAALTGFTGYASVLMTMGLAGRLATLSGVAARSSPKRRAGRVPARRSDGVGGPDQPHRLVAAPADPSGRRCAGPADGGVLSQPGGVGGAGELGAATCRLRMLRGARGADDRGAGGAAARQRGADAGRAGGGGLRQFGLGRGASPSRRRRSVWASRGWSGPGAAAGWGS